MKEAKHTLVVMVDNLGQGHQGNILITTEERIKDRTPPVADHIVTKEYAHFIVQACNSNAEREAVIKGLVDACEKIVMHEDNLRVAGIGYDRIVHNLAKAALAAEKEIEL